MKRTKKPRDISIARGMAKGVQTHLSTSPGDEIAEGSFWTYDSRQLRRLARWCAEAAAWLDANNVNPRRFER